MKKTSLAETINEMKDFTNTIHLHILKCYHTNVTFLPTRQNPSLNANQNLKCFKNENSIIINQLGSICSAILEHSRKAPTFCCTKFLRP